jgi:acetate kinase
MEWCGLSLHEEKNNAAIGVEGPISTSDASISVYVIPSDEEAIIARETARLFQ